jgi:hypothetical protein
MKMPFRRTMTQKTQDNIAALTKRGIQLDAQRSAARAALDKATKARQDAFLGVDEIDEQKVAKLQRAVSDAAGLLQGIEDAIGVLSQEKAQAEAQLHAERDRAAREIAAKTFEARVAAIEAGLAPWLEQSRIWSDALAALAHMHFGCDEMSKFLQNSMAQLEVAANFQLAELRAMPKAILDGSMAIPAPKPPEPAPVTVTEQPRTQTVFLLRSVKYKDAAGKTVYATGLEDCEMPIEIAQRALRSGAAVNLSNPKRRELKGAKGGTHGDPNALNNTDLDAISDFSGAHYAGPGDPVLREANFVEIDRSAEARVIQIAAGRVA